MNNIITFIVLCLFYTCAYNQTYVEYYLLCNEADSMTYMGQKKEALENYKKAFQTVDYVHVRNLEKAYSLSQQLKMFDDMYAFGRQLIINSGNDDFLKAADVEFKSTDYYHALKDSALYFKKMYEERINHRYIEIIDSLYYIDQRIIRNNKSVRGKYQIIRSELPENLFDLDSSNWNYLYQLIHTFGFPSERNIGLNAYGKAWAILHHNLRLKENEKYHPEIFQYVADGDYLPNDILVWYEQFQTQVYGRTFFTTWDNDISEENLKRIDTNRRKFYMKGINSLEFKKGGRFIITKW
ncbi:MAG: hypothetical protein J0G96_09385 [Flavobacteriia bacterium]|nr:hypothetical protein [Flavobacteriia bacterium]OJX39213.1 MAG: hypothetical protein BGO87_04310 [Flavobacteriia bacterium 40-80]